MIGVAGEVLVHEIEGVPLEIDGFVIRLGLAVGCESLVHEVADVKVNCRLESFLLHPLAAVTGK